MKKEILILLSNRTKLTTTEISNQLGLLNRVAYKHLSELASKSEIRRVSIENGSFGISVSWALFV